VGGGGGSGSERGDRRVLFQGGATAQVMLFFIKKIERCLQNSISLSLYVFLDFSSANQVWKMTLF
jgi:hypothetical protein